MGFKPKKFGKRTSKKLRGGGKSLRKIGGKSLKEVKKDIGSGSRFLTNTVGKVGKSLTSPLIMVMVVGAGAVVLMSVIR